MRWAASFITGIYDVMFLLSGSFYYQHKHGKLWIITKILLSRRMVWASTLSILRTVIALLVTAWARGEAVAFLPYRLFPFCFRRKSAAVVARQ